MENKIVDLDEVSKYPHKLDKLIIGQARRMNQLLKLAFSAMHATVPNTSLCSWHEDKEGNKYLQMGAEDTIRLTAPSDKDLEGIPYIGPCLGGVC